MTEGKIPTVLLTRNAEENERIAPVFEAEGLAPLSFPGIVIAPPKDWSEADAAIADLESYDGIFFTSRNAVRSFLSRLDRLRTDGRDVLKTTFISAVGEKTEEALAAEAIRIDVVPETGSADNLLASLDGMDVGGKHFLFPKSDIARDVLPSELRERGAFVAEIVVYRTVPPEGGSLDDIRSGIVNGSIRCIAFFSPSSVRNIVQMLGSHCLQTADIAVIGPTTAATARSMGLEPTIVSPASTAEALAHAIAEKLARDTEHQRTRRTQ